MPPRRLLPPPWPGWRSVRLAPRWCSSTARTGPPPPPSTSTPDPATSRRSTPRSPRDTTPPPNSMSQPTGPRPPRRPSSALSPPPHTCDRNSPPAATPHNPSASPDRLSDRASCRVPLLHQLGHRLAQLLELKLFVIAQHVGVVRVIRCGPGRLRAGGQLTAGLPRETRD